MVVMGAVLIYFVLLLFDVRIWGLLGTREPIRSAVGVRSSSLLRGVKNNMFDKKEAVVVPKDVEKAAATMTNVPPTNLNALLLVPVVWGSYSPVVKSLVGR